MEMLYQKQHKIQSNIRDITRTLRPPTPETAKYQGSAFFRESEVSEITALQVSFRSSPGARPLPGGRRRPAGPGTGPAGGGATPSQRARARISSLLSEGSGGAGSPLGSPLGSVRGRGPSSFSGMGGGGGGGPPAEGDWSRRSSATRAAAAALMLENALPPCTEVNIWGEDDDSSLAPLNDLKRTVKQEYYEELARREAAAAAALSDQQAALRRLASQRDALACSTLGRLRAFTPVRGTLPETLSDREGYDHAYQWPLGMVHTAESVQLKVPVGSDFAPSPTAGGSRRTSAAGLDDNGSEVGRGREEEDEASREGGGEDGLGEDDSGGGGAKSQRASLRHQESGGTAATAGSYHGARYGAGDLVKVFGTQARNEFFELYRIVARRTGKVLDPEAELEEGALSPRQAYLQEVARTGAVPFPVLLRKLQRPKDLDLSGKGLGDRVIGALAKILPRVPEVQRLSVADNRLTDASLVPLCEAVLEMPHLTALDLSNNKVDESADIIREYLTQPDCRLRRLTLSSADVDDGECGQLCESLKRNVSLTELDLSRNLIGEKENMNVVQPDFETGAEALAEMLEHNTHITHLDLSWNAVRLESAVALAQVLRENNTLRTLILKHNAFGDKASQELGDALAYNGGLAALDLSFNGVTPRAAMVLANAFKTNAALRRLNLDGNTLGKSGSASLMMAVVRAKDSRLLEVSMNNCDLDHQEPGLFNPLQPTGKYRLEMAEPYARMVAAELLRLANERLGCDFRALHHVWRGQRTQVPVRRGRLNSDAGELGWLAPARRLLAEWGRPEEERRLERIVAELQATLNALGLRLPGLGPGGGGGATHHATHLLENLRLGRYTGAELHGVDPGVVIDAIFRSIFHMVDKDKSDAVDQTELLTLFLLLGLGGGSGPAAAAGTTAEAAEGGSVGTAGEEDPGKELKKQIAYILTKYDTDGSGQIEEDEFVMWMTERFAKGPETSKKVLMDPSGNHAWAPPVEGILEVDFVAEKLQVSTHDASGDAGVRSLVENIKRCKTDIERANLLNKAIIDTDIYLTCSQALELVELAASGAESSLDLLVKLLPQMAGPEECWRLVDKMVGARGPEALALRARLGPAFGPLMGNCSGHYLLDLREDMDRLACRKIAEVANYQRRYSQDRSERGDTSQKHNWQNYRNERLNGAKHRLTTEWFIQIPLAGRLEFDYVSTERPSRGQTGLSNNRFRALLRRLDLGPLRRAAAHYAAAYERARRARTERAAAAAMAKIMGGASPVTQARRTINLMRSSVSAATRRSRNSSNVDGSEEGQEDQKNTMARKKSFVKGKKQQEEDDGLSSTLSSMGSAFTNVKMPAEDRLPFDKHGVYVPPAPGAVFLSRHLLPPREAPGDVWEGAPAPEPPEGASVVLEAGKRWRAYLGSSHLRYEWLGPEKERYQAKKDALDDISQGGGGSVAASTAPPAASTPRPPKGGAAAAAAAAATPTSPAQPGTPHSGAGAGSGPGAGAGAGAEGATAAVAAAQAAASSAMNAEMMAAAEGAVDGWRPTELWSFAAAKLLQLEVLAGPVWLTAQQAWEIAGAFPYHDFCRVQALVTLFGRIVDVGNCDVFLSAVAFEEKVELLHRLGALNLLNPLKPDGKVWLDLRAWDQREWCKVLCRLAAEEPGENWLGEVYQWTRAEAPVPGWVLPKSWTEPEDAVHALGLENGPRKNGRLTTTYTSDPALGCAPVWEVRKELQARTLSGGALQY